MAYTQKLVASILYTVDKKYEVTVSLWPSMGSQTILLQKKFDSSEEAEIVLFETIFEASTERLAEINPTVGLAETQDQIQAPEPPPLPQAEKGKEDHED